MPIILTESTYCGRKQGSGHWSRTHTLITWHTPAQAGADKSFCLLTWYVGEATFTRPRSYSMNLNPRHYASQGHARRVLDYAQTHYFSIRWARPCRQAHMRSRPAWKAHPASTCLGGARARGALFVPAPGRARTERTRQPA
jgi:hypothetical protein